MKKYYFLIFILILSAINNVFARTKVYVVGVENYYKPPFQYIENDEYKGRYRYIIDKFAKENGYKFIYKPMKLSRLYLELYNNTIDFKFPDNPVWRGPDKKDHKIFYSTYANGYIDAIFVKRDTYGQKIDFYRNLGVVDDVLLWNITKLALNNKIKITKARTCEELVHLLLEGKIDSFLCNLDVVEEYFKKSNTDFGIKFDPNLPYVDDYYYLSTSKHNKIIYEFNDWVYRNRTKINNFFRYGKEF